MAKQGRPSKLQNIDLKQVEACGAMGCTIEEVALLFGVSQTTIKNWKKNQEFLAALKRGRAKADNQVEQRLYKKALDGDTTAMIFWLKNRRPDRWRDRAQMELSGQVGTPDNKLIVEVVHVRGEKK